MEERLILSEDLEKEIWDLRRQASSFFRDKNYEGMKKVMLKSWDQLPDPKTRYDESFWIAHMMCEAAIGEKNIPLAEEWIKIYKIANLSRIDGGERVFMEGRIAYMKEDFDAARELFKQADKISKGRVFGDAALIEYLKFYKKK